MAQTHAQKKKTNMKGKSSGSVRKKVGTTKKHLAYSGRASGKNSLRDKANSTYISSVEASMASRLPSDQRSKLTVVKPGANPSAIQSNKKHQKKPLTRGRKRK
eukprot:Tbor_TRINITY_DN5714_c3_g3::TRINITY_DN5714_c3_g3_i1::g.19587::m.19587